jgi:hypothetical protein
MKKLYFHLSLASILSGFIFTPLFVFAQSDQEISQPEAVAPVRAPAADSDKPAASTSATRDSKGEKIKTLNFEDELVEGGTQKPELFYLFQKKNFNYKRLIKLRENFLPEMRKTSEEVQRVRSQD